MKKTIYELVEYLNTCRDSYYNGGIPIMSDREYDKLFDKLRTMEEQSGIILANSPTQTVGYTVKSELPKVKHSYPLLSLDKTKKSHDFMKFCSKYDSLLMLKLDGLTVQLTYNNGELVRAETRGDGYVGEDITHNALTFYGVPKTIPIDREVRITGEAIIKYDDFKCINTKFDDDNKFKTPRNLVSGSVRQLDSKVCYHRKVRFIVWNANDLSNDDTMVNGLLTAGNYGFEIVHNTFIKSGTSNISEFKIILDNMRNRAKRCEIPIDGIVGMYNDIKMIEELGNTSHHFRNGLAYKFYDDKYETVIRDIEYTIGKTGVLTPVAVFDEVDIDGAKVSRASLHNISVMSNMKIMIGDNVNVIRANGVIPQVVSNNTKHDNYNYLDVIVINCPYCGGKTTVVIESSGVYNLMCKNSECFGNILKNISAFVSKSAMNIEGLSEKSLEKFIKLGYIKKYSDVYNLIPKYGHLIKLEDGFGDKSINALNNHINKSRKTTLDRLITSLNIDGVGKSYAKELSKYCKENPIKFLELTYDEIVALDGFGETLATSITKWISDSDNYSEFLALVRELEFEEQNTKVINSNLTFVITGKLEKFKNRKELEDYITNNVGKVSSSVSSSTSYLINNDTESSSSKNKKAKELGVKIISEQEFIDMFGK